MRHIEPADDSDEPPRDAEVISKTTTSDGFTFTTFQRAGKVHCLAQRGSREVVVSFRPARGQSHTVIPQEILEFTAQSVLEAAGASGRGRP
jgi:hypothetical protein